MHIIITHNDDNSSTEVCEWFQLAEIDFQRMNLDIVESAKYAKLNEDLNQLLNKIYFNFQNIPTSKIGKDTIGDKFIRINSIWFRRPYAIFPELKNSHSLNYHNDINLSSEIKLNKINEFRNFVEYYFYSLKSQKKLGDFYKSKVNKLVMLEIANEIGFNIPVSVVINNKIDLQKFKKKFKNGIIVKSIYEPILTVGDDNKVIFNSLTVKIEDGNLKKIPKSFSQSLVQEYIEKQYEIRSFYMNGKIYSQAIFSQNNNKTMVDYRNYDYRNPNRAIPYKLPQSIESMLKDFMNKIGLNCGSIDLIKSKNGLYYFLEINPIGQFSSVSKSCNYNLEYEIFNYLCQ